VKGIHSYLPITTTLLCHSEERSDEESRFTMANCGAGGLFRL
jgi:hypothetical protein